MATTQAQASDPKSGVPFPTSATAGAAASAIDHPPATESKGEGGGSGGDAGATKPSDVVNQVAQMAHDTIDKLAERAAPKVQRLQEGVAQTNQMLQDRAGTLRDMGEEWTDTLRTTVRDNPLASLAAAGAVGMLLAYLMRSPD